MSEENKQVKFLRKTPTEFKNIVKKDQNTFYHVTDASINELYFGNEKLTNSEDISAIDTTITEKLKATEQTIKEQTDSSLSHFANPNLLINGDFQIHQSQRNYYAYKSDAKYPQFTVDGWELCNGGSVSIVNNNTGLQLTHKSLESGEWGLLRQEIKNPQRFAGKTVYLSASSESLEKRAIELVYYDKDGNRIKTNGTGYDSKTTDESGPAVCEGKHTVPADITNDHKMYFCLWVPNDPKGQPGAQTAIWHWAKLEIGEQRTQFVPKSYEEELADCGEIEKGINLSMSNPTLLMNGNFCSNSRGESEYNMSNAIAGQETFDKWIHYNSYNYTLKQKSGGGIEVSSDSKGSSDFAQFLTEGNNFLNQKIVTASIKTDRGIHYFTTTVEQITDDFKKTSIEVYSGEGTASAGRLYLEYQADGRWKIWFRVYAGKTLLIDWIKLEAGNKATNFSIPNIDEERRKCLASEEAFNQNLLTNGDFNINQRKQSVYLRNPDDKEQYTIDKWKLVGNIELYVKNNGIQLTNPTFIGTTTWAEIVQYVDIDLAGKMVTASINHNGSVYKYTVMADPSMSKTNGGTIPGFGTISVKYASEKKKYYVGIYATKGQYQSNIDHIFHWVKLEYGSVATPFQPTSKEEELIKCQRYYQVLSASDLGLLGIPRDTSSIAMDVNYKQKMVKIPTISAIFNTNSLLSIWDISANNTTILTQSANGIYIRTRGDNHATVQFKNFNNKLIMGHIYAIPVTPAGTDSTILILSAEE